jgi:hypothetical protein
LHQSLIADPGDAPRSTQRRWPDEVKHDIVVVRAAVSDRQPKYLNDGVRHPSPSSRVLVSCLPLILFSAFAFAVGHLTRHDDIPEFPSHIHSVTHCYRRPFGIMRLSVGRQLHDCLHCGFFVALDLFFAIAHLRTILVDGATIGVLLPDTIARVDADVSSRCVAVSRKLFTAEYAPSRSHLAKDLAVRSSRRRAGDRRGVFGQCDRFVTSPAIPH